MRSQISKWLPALLMMLIIFWFSAQPGDVLLLTWTDWLIRKVGHMIGYALLGLSYWYAFDFKPEQRWLAWLLAVLYAVTDELHQSFVPGRHPSLWDVTIFDNGGALISLWLASLYRKQKRPLVNRAVAEQLKH